MVRQAKAVRAKDALILWGSDEERAGLSWEHMSDPGLFWGLALIWTRLKSSKDDDTRRSLCVLFQGLLAEANRRYDETLEAPSTVTT
jgi:hypothetical protein